MTASRALRHVDHVSAATGKRVRALARKLGYRPDPHLTALAAYRQRLRPPAEREIIAYLTTDNTRQGFLRTKVGSEVLAGRFRAGSGSNSATGWSRSGSRTWKSIIAIRARS